MVKFIKTYNDGKTVNEGDVYCPYHNDGLSKCGLYEDVECIDGGQIELPPKDCPLRNGKSIVELIL